MYGSVLTSRILIFIQQSFKQNVTLVVFAKTNIMDAYEKTRRGFLKKLGLTIGATITSTALLSANIQEPEAELVRISPEQQAFMDRYEKWMDEFIEVIRVQKADPDNYENNKKIVELSETAKQWQNKLGIFMQDENFARYYMFKTQRMTLEI